MTTALNRPSRNRPDGVVAYTDDELEELLAMWTGYGHKPEDIQKDAKSLRVKVGEEATLEVQFEHIIFHGTVTDDAVAAAVRHAQDAWGGSMGVDGTDDFRMRVWAHAQVAGVNVTNYEPPLHLRGKANSLASKYFVEMVNYQHGVYNDGSLDGENDNRPWGYHGKEPTPEARDMMRRVERAMGLGRTPEAPTI